MLKQTTSVEEWISEKTKSQKRRISSPTEEQTKRFAVSSLSSFHPQTAEEVVDVEKAYRGASPVVISDWLQTFKVMPKDIQLEALKELVELCSVKQVKHLQSVIAPHFKRDFISCLPKEISLKILSYLSPKDLVNGALLCKRWKQLMEDSILWLEKCKQYFVKEVFPPCHSRQENWDICIFQSQKINDKNQRAEIISDTFPLFEIIDQPCTSSSLKHSFIPLNNLAEEFRNIKNSCYIRSKWKAVFLRNERIKNNWIKRRLTASCQLRGHDEHVITCVHLYQDILVTGSDDNTIRVWSSNTAQCLHVLTGHQGGVWTLQLSEDGKTLVSGSTDRTVRVWNLKLGLLIHTLHGHTSTVRCMSLQKHILVSGSRDSTVKVWDVKEGYCVRTLYGHIAAVRCVQCDGEIIISGGYDNRIIVWDLDTGAQKVVLEGHTNRVYSLLYEKERELIISGSLDTTIKVWNSRTGECLQTLVGHQSLTSGMQLRGDLLVSANADSTIKVWNIVDGQCLHTLSGQHRHSSAVTSLQFLENGLVATSGDDGFVKLWDVKRGSFICDLVKLGSSGAGGCVWRLKATPTMLVCAVGSRNGTEDTKLILMDFDSPYP